MTAATTDAFAAALRRRPSTPRTTRWPRFASRRAITSLRFWSGAGTSPAPVAARSAPGRSSATGAVVPRVCLANSPDASPRARTARGAGADLFHAVASLGGLLKTGVGGALGRLGFKTAAAPRPSDAALVVVFVIGGVSPGEIADVRAAAAGLGVVGGETKVEDILVGGTGLLGEFDVLRLVAARDA